MTASTTATQENAAIPTPGAAAPKPADGPRETAQERAQRLAVQLRDCLGLDAMLPQEAGDLARMTVASTLLDHMPDDEIDSMATAHILTTHLYAMKCFKSVNQSGGDDRARIQYLAQAGRLIALHSRQVDRIERRRQARQFLAEQARREQAAAKRLEEGTAYILNAQRRQGGSAP
jgi:hypothetical protein